MKFWRCTCCGEEWIAPEHKVCFICGGDDAVEEYQPPITLRDFFAGCELIGLQAADTPMDSAWSLEERASIAYTQADEMLKGRGM